jgi:cell division protein FtsZ
MIQFDLPKEKLNIIKVLGVGGGGGNAVNHMHNQGIKGVDFIICNTDQQALEASPIVNKLQIGNNLTGGLGAGSNPEVGEKAALESLEQIVEILGVNTKMLFITAGMGGGTGTGAAPIIAKTAKDLGILTVGIVTTPFKVEGNKRKVYADDGLQKMKDSVDCLLVISNDKIMQLHGSQKFSNAFSHANNILTTAAKGIAEIITVTGYINVDFEDVKTVMTNSGVAIMGTAQVEGEHRALDAIEQAMTSPLLNDNKIKGAKNILLNITSGTNEATMTEIEQITEYVQREAEVTTDIILGLTQDESLGEKMTVTIIATGFEPIENRPIQPQVQWVKRNLVESPNMETQHQMAQAEPDTAEKQFELFDAANPSETPQAEVELSFEITDVTTQIPAEPLAEEVPQKNMEVTPVDELERVEKLKQRMIEMRTLSQNIRNPQTLEEMFSVPAYVRKGTNLDHVPHSSENNLSRISLIEEQEEYKHQLKPGNTFLHDNVD